MTFKPLLASKIDADRLEELTYPLIASPKVDGIRCLLYGGQAVSRKLKPIQNNYIRQNLAQYPDGWDGELVTFTDGKLDDFNTVQSKVMSIDGEPEFEFWVFDNFTIDAPYRVRYNSLWTDVVGNFVEPLKSQYVDDVSELIRLENKWVGMQGWEGVMLRHLQGPYKHGRSNPPGKTINAAQQTLLKLKKFLDDEGRITKVVELMRNQNEAKKDALGHTERSSSKEGKVPAGTMGCIEVQWRDTTFEIGTGFTAEMRQEIWDQREELIGSLITFKYQEIGSQGRPRFPVFLGFRPELEEA